MKTPTFLESLSGTPLGIDASFKEGSNLPDFSRFEEWELKEFREFVKEPHHQHEWEAFFKFVALPPWKRNLSRIAGVLVRIFGL